MEAPPAYTDSSYQTSYYPNPMEQLQNLPPPANDEPNLLDVQQNQQNNGGWDTANEVATSNMETPQPSSQNLNSFPSAEVEDKIKDILSRYNPNVNPSPAAKDSNTMDPFRSENQTPPQESPQQSRQVTNTTPQFLPPQPNRSQQYNQPPQQSPAHKAQIHQPPQPLVQHNYLSPQQPSQLRATVVQNVPSQGVNSPPPTPQRMAPQQSPIPVYQQQNTYQPQPSYNNNPPSLQHSVNQSVQQPSLPQQNPSQSFSHNSPLPQQQQQQTQTTPPLPQPNYGQHPQQAAPTVAQPHYSYQQHSQMPQNNYPPSQYQQPVPQFQSIPQVQQPVPQVQQPVPQVQSPVSNNREIFNQMTSYFDRISSYMERMEKRLVGLEKTAQDILKNQKKQNNPDDLSSFIAKGELESLKKMQEQMEKDFDIAKKMQAEFDKDRAKSTPTRSTPTPRSHQPTPAPSSLQECPICGTKVPFLELEYHVNQCLEGSEKSDTPTTQEKASFWKRVFGPGPKKEEQSSSNQVVVRNNTTPSKNQSKNQTSTTPTTGPIPLYPGNGQEFFQMPLMYRGPPQMMPQMYGGYPQQIYYYPPNMAPQNQNK